MGPDLEKAAQRIGLSMRLYQAAQEAKLGDEEEVNQREALLLELLLHKEQMSISEISAAYPGLSESTVSTQVTKLWRDKKMVTKTIDPENQRVTLVELTDKGRKTIENILEQRKERAVLFFHAIDVTEEEKKILANIFNRASDFIDEHLGVWATKGAGEILKNNKT